MQDPEFAAARHAAQPDKGWDYDIGAEPTEGLRRAIAQRLAQCQDFTFAVKRPGQPDKTLGSVDVRKKDFWKQVVTLCYGRRKALFFLAFLAPTSTEPSV